MEIPFDMARNCFCKALASVILKRKFSIRIFPDSAASFISMKVRVLISPLIVLLLTSCGTYDKLTRDNKITDTSVSTDTTLPAGWTKASSDNGISMGIAPGWTAKDLTKGEVSDAMNEGKKAMGVKGNVNYDINKTIKLWVFKNIQPGTFQSNINVQETPVPAGTTNDQVAASAVNEMSSIAAPPTTSSFQTSSGAAICLTSSKELDIHGTKMTTDLHSILLVKGENCFVLTLISPAGSKDMDVLEQMAKSIKVP